MQFIFFVCCCILPLSMSVYVYGNNAAIEDIELKIDELEQNLELMKQKLTDPIQPKRQDPPTMSKQDSWSDPAVFKDKAAIYEETKFQQETLMDKMLLYTKDVQATTDEITSMGGSVPVQLGEDLVIANMPYDKVGSHFKTASTHVPKTASPQTLSYVKAYWKNIQAETTEQQPEIHKWTDKTAPMLIHRRHGDSPNQANQRSTMTGKIAAIVLIVSGPGNLAMTDNEVINIKAEAMTGVQFWADQAPSSASLSFSVHSGIARITTMDSLSCSSDDFSVCHNRFAIPAIQSFGATKLEDIENYVLQHTNAVGAFTVFFSKYRQSHYAYAYYGGGPIYMQYSNDGWGPDQIDRVYAHEMGHVFNSPDEYQNCDCNTQYGKGSCTERNLNCNTCTASQEDCIMDTNDFSLCQYTKKHVGWCE